MSQRSHFLNPLVTFNVSQFVAAKYIEINLILCYTYGTDKGKPRETGGRKATGLNSPLAGENGGWVAEKR